MQCFRPMACLTIFAVILSLMATSTEANNKIHNCCTEVSRQKITATIIGARVQKKNLPCVNAIIFETVDGEVCSHWKEDWVRKAFFQLENARKLMISLNATTILPGDKSVNTSP
ncbi:hypothetical protein UPYG_G00294520 [Umbra pygmaea]|uniref:Chemokine interleukin-8-like domain-containing protein n=1 Tax=Umbra pygmaea TaxID=75934 RepID=A0ABD0W5T5_UMBPY